MVLIFHSVASELENIDSSLLGVPFRSINNDKLCPYPLLGAFLRYWVHNCAYLRIKIITLLFPKKRGIIWYQNQGTQTVKIYIANLFLYQLEKAFLAQTRGVNILYM